MLILLHGDNTIASRKELEFYKARAKGKEIIVLDGTKVDKTSLIQALESKSLLGEERLIIIESLLGGKRKPIFLDTLEENKNQEIILWERKEITKLTLEKLPKNIIIKLFKFEKILFKFLESIRPKNTKNLLFLYQETLKKEEPELIFYMLIRQIRNLILAKDGISQLSTWQTLRLTNQARYFTMEQLLDLYQKLLTIDIGQKTGSSPFSFKKTTELFLIDV